MSKGDAPQPQKAKKPQQKQQQPKKEKGSINTGQPPSVPAKDLFHRLNYSLQASVFLQSLGESSGSCQQYGGREVNVVKDRKGKRRAVENPSSSEDGFRKLARMGMRESNTMVVHNQLKLQVSYCYSNKNTFSIAHQTCLTCSTRLSIPAPPTSLSSASRLSSSVPADPSAPGHTVEDSFVDPLDGPIRAARRRKAAKKRKAPFHQLEGADNVFDGRKGHVLWKGEDKVEGWGIQAPRHEAA
ncbi:hypothetical protein I350_05572 [Cryptococcus amylolentus CBS 6273]|uniref:Uncharacterized protein n=1 Tax=Cryptococcus amylolentus CBS 6273 TaxID=1296118 RepID=A0A1E3JVS3_9TREE|nr:hypothetical protein I350_05572 [Cryptococcus amylolentus CBS 6273]